MNNKRTSKFKKFNTEEHQSIRQLFPQKKNLLTSSGWIVIETEFLINLEGPDRSLDENKSDRNVSGPWYVNVADRP